MGRLFVGLLFLILLGEGVAQTHIDILALYTGDAERYHNDKDGVLALVRSSVASANTGFANSEIGIRLRLKGLEKIDYQESYSEMGDDLDHISSSAEIAALRNEMGADLVVLFRGDSANNTVGVAWVLDSVDGESHRGFSVVSSLSSISNFVFQHEIGHNLGSVHDERNANGKDGLFAYSHGYRFEGAQGDTEYRTIMAYAPGSRINYFSNPDVRFGGVAVGDSDADNGRTFASSGPWVAAYRDFAQIDPVASAGEDRTREDLDGDGKHAIILDGSNSWSIDVVVEWKWTWSGGSASGKTVTADFPLGVTDVMLTVTDSLGSQNTDTVKVRVVEQSPIVSFDAGYSHSLFVKSYGGLYGAGRNGDGQLGFISNDNYSGMVEIYSQGVRSVSGGLLHSLVLRTDGSLLVLGDHNGAYGWDRENRELMSEGVAAVSSAFRHSLILMEDGSVWGMGENGIGQLADGTYEYRAEPVKSSISGVVAIEASNGLSLYLKDDGSLWTSGLRNAANWNRGDTTPVMIFPSGVKSMAAGGMADAMAVMEDGSLWAVGYRGLRADGKTGSDDLQDPIELMDSGVVGVESGGSFTLIWKEDGSLWSVGRDLFDPESINRWVVRSRPAMIIGSGVTEVSAGDEHALIGRSDGSVWAVGSNRFQELGVWGGNRHKAVQVFQGDKGILNTPPIAEAGDGLKLPDGDGSGFSSVRMDGSGSRDDWQIASWHWSWEGGTAEGESIEADFPVGTTEVTLRVVDTEGAFSEDSVSVTVSPVAKASAVEMGWRHSVVLKEDGSLWGFGDSAFGQLGVVDANFAIEMIMIAGEGVVDFAVDSDTTYIVKEDGSLWHTRAYSDSEIRDLSLEGYSSLEKIVELDVSKVFVYGRSVFFIKRDGSLWGMGSNRYGKLGYVSVDFHEAPIEIFGNGVVQVAAADDFSVFLMDDGSVWGAGNHPFKPWSETGSGLEKVVVGDVIEIAAGQGFAAFRRGDGSLAFAGNVPLVRSDGWGEVTELFEEGVKKIDGGLRDLIVTMEDGRLLSLLVGRGGGFDYASKNPKGPFDVLAYSGVVDTASGYENLMIVREDGSLWSVGNNRERHLGMSDGSFFEFLERVAIGPSAAVNEAPTADAGMDIRLADFSGDGSQLVVLDGSKSHDDWQVLEWKWTWSGGEAEGRFAKGEFPMGETLVTLEVTDGTGAKAVDELIIEVKPPIDVVAISSGYPNMFLMEDGSVYARDASILPGMHYLGEGSCIRIFESGATKVSSADHALILDEAGAVWSVGFGYNGQLGDGFTFSRPFARKIVESGAEDVFTGRQSSFVLKEGGSLWGFGANSRGQLGIGADGIQFKPIELLESGVAQVAAGNEHSVFLMEDGSVWGGGYNYNGNLGRVSEEAGEASDQAIFLIEDMGAVSVAVSDTQTFVSRADGSVWCYGHGELQSPFEVVEARDAIAVGASIGSIYIHTKENALLGIVGLVDDGSLDYNSERHEIFGSEVGEVARGRGPELVRRVDGSIWERYNKEETSIMIYGPKTSRVNGAPTAIAGSDIWGYARNNRNYATISFSTWYSRDDWQIARWEVEYDEGIYGGTDLDWITIDAPLGESEIILTVWDDEGLSTSDTIKLKIFEMEVFEEWMLQYYTRDQMNDFWRSGISEDTDGDGYSSSVERRLGTNPTVADTLFGSEEFDFENIEGTLCIRVRPYYPALLYEVLGFAESGKWEVLNLARREEEGDLLFELTGNNYPVLRVRVSDDGLY